MRVLIGPESDTASVCRVFIFKAPGYSPLRGQPACAKMAAYPLQSVTVTVTVEASAGPGLRLGLRLAMPGWAGRDSTPAPGPLWRSLTIPGPSNWTFGLWRVKVLVIIGPDVLAAAAARTGEWGFGLWRVKGKVGLTVDFGLWRVKVLATLRSRQAAAAARTEWGKAGLNPRRVLRRRYPNIA